jgi:hypothetical protein
MIIGVSGKARSGKDQFGEYLTKHMREKHLRTLIHMAFATQLKMMCKTNFGLDDDQLWGDKKEIPDLRFAKDGHGFSSNPSDYWTPREIMQELGGFYRKITSNYWVMALDYEIKKGINRDVIVTDVRHLNECAYIKDSKGVLIRVVREDADAIHGMEHESETALNEYTDFDIEIDNSGTLEDLDKAAENTSDAIITLERLMTKGGNYNGK